MVRMGLSKHVWRIFVLQCLVIGVNPMRVDPGKRDWFLDHTWKPWQRNLFVRLTSWYLILSRGARCELLDSPWLYGGKAKKAAKEWAWNYGWKETYFPKA